MSKKIVWWLLGLFFLLSTLSALSVNSAFSFIFFLMATIVSLPHIYKYASAKFNLNLKPNQRIIIMIIGLLFGNSFMPKNITDKSLAKPTVTTVITKASNKVSITPTIVFYDVLKVIDGDTVNLNINNKKETIRLIGINSPETQDPRKPVECFGKEASLKAKEVLTNKRVRVESDPTQGDKDKYNRLLRYIYLEDGTSFNKLMIEEGYAFEYTYNIPYKYQTEFKKAQKDAELNKKGLWGDGACITPTAITQQNIIQPSQTIKPTTNIQTSKPYSCNSCKRCTEMSSCEEALFYFNSCNCYSLDGDSDGTPCESLCN